MDVNPSLSRFGRFVQNNSPTIFTVAGVVGAVATAALVGSAAFRAGRITQQFDDDAGYIPDRKRRMQTYVEMTWRLYIPAAVVGGVTVASVVLANRVGQRRTAALAAGYAILDRTFGEYKKKVVDTIGPKKEQTVRDKVAADRVAANPFDQLSLIGSGSVVCYDAYTGRYFLSDMETIRGAVNDVNHSIIHDNYASLSDFYNHVGLAPTSVSDEFGWNSDHLLEVDYSTTLSVSGVPCISINYNTAPIRQYSRLQ